MLLSRMTHRKMGAFSPPQVNTSAHVQSSMSSFLFKNNAAKRETLRHSRRLQSHFYALQAPAHHLQTYTTSFLPFIATRGLATLSGTFKNRNNVHNRSLPDWSPRGVVVVGGVAVGVKGVSKDKGGFKNLHGRISSLQIKKRMQRKKKKIQDDLEEVRLLLFCA